MKKLLSVFLVLVLVFAMTGCQQSAPAPQQSSEKASAAQPSGDSKAAAPASPSPEAKQYQIGFSIAVRDQFLTSLEMAATKKAEELGVKFEVYEAKEDISTQISHVQTCAVKGFDAMVVNMVNADNAAEVLAAAGDMKVVFVNRAPDLALLEKGKYVYVGSDENVSGRLQGEFLAKHFQAEGKTSINIVVFKGDLTHPATPARTNSALNGLKEGGIEYNILYEDTANFDRATAMNKFVQFMGKGETVDAVICNNDEMALGVIEAMKTSGTGEIFCPVVGIDATVVGCESVKAGEMAFTVFQSAVGQGAGSVQAAVDILNGKDLQNANEDGTISWVAFEPVGPDNVDDYM
ncbi:MAG: substrate-binding domain-containing protein [Oscillospiraceae bacterium]